MIEIDRRKVLRGSLVGAAGASLSLLDGGPTGAATPASGQQAAAFYRYKVGNFELTAINDGTWFRPIDETFVKNAPYAEVKKALADSFQRPTVCRPRLRRSRQHRHQARPDRHRHWRPIGAQSRRTRAPWEANLAAAGIEPKAVDAILISHFHADHINGLKTKDGAPVFPNAEISVVAPEWAYWMDDAGMHAAHESVRPYFLNARRVFSDIAKDVRRFEPGGEVAPGITAIATYGHTPGHTSYLIASGNQSVLALGDVAQNPFVFVRHPQWQPSFDTDGALAAALRTKMLDRAGRRQNAGAGLSLPLPRGRPHPAHRRELRLRAGTVAGKPVDVIARSAATKQSNSCQTPRQSWVASPSARNDSADVIARSAATKQSNPCQTPHQSWIASPSARNDNAHVIARSAATKQSNATPSSGLLRFARNDAFDLRSPRKTPKASGEPTFGATLRDVY